MIALVHCPSLADKRFARLVGEHIFTLSPNSRIGFVDKYSTGGLNVDQRVVSELCLYLLINTNDCLVPTYSADCLAMRGMENLKLLLVTVYKVK